MDIDLKTLSLDRALMSEGLIGKAQMEEAREERFRSERTFPAILIDMGLLKESALLDFLKAKMGYEVVSLKDATIEASVYELIPKGFAVHKRLTPVRFEYDALVLAMEDPTDFHLIEDLRHRLGFQIKPVAASSKDIETALARYPESGLAAARKSERPIWIKITGSVFFPLMLVLPIALIMGVLIQNEFPAAKKTVTRWIANKYDFTIQFMVLYGMWSVILWFFNGLLFPPPEKREE